MLPALRPPPPAASTVPYTYCSPPRAVPARPKYRAPLEADEPVKEPARWANLMYDRRVVRGNTYARQAVPMCIHHPNAIEIQRQREARRRALARKRAEEQIQLRTPEPVEGRKHIHVQTELYLEEISDRIIEVDVECQTDAFLDRPPTPFFVPAKTGRDMATQIEEGELFDFDIEVKPILEVLIGKTVEQALLEVMEEEELAELWAHQRAYAELRNAELAEVQRLEEQDRRYREEKERCKQLQMQMLQKEKETMEKIAAQAFAKRYLADLIPSVFNNLHESGFFYDPIERDIETEFLPWLMTEVEETLEKKTLGRVMLDSLIRTVTEKRLDAFSRKPLPDQIEALAEERRPTDNAPLVAAETEAADQAVTADEETDQPAAEEQASRHITFQLEEADQEEMEDSETD
ncbi:radial spoke head protein 3 homolog [Meleagris gallopavo]|uniref:Radial spoke head 3 n=1 Tax=Meleagris gallopavo TaxID=9103 RepID=G1NJR6_MELGA|nr:radial spoke head protein 3 homolog [Meleagris gallopavo]XP_019468493.1 radial spoke head protein 3 homolog [Meleagris gallopavo]XP_031408342.1 radial spoke head protein 3 homolog [Meleagris gallopavo]